MNTNTDGLPPPSLSSPAISDSAASFKSSRGQSGAKSVAFNSLDKGKQDVNEEQVGRGGFRHRASKKMVSTLALLPPCVDGR